MTAFTHPEVYDNSVTHSLTRKLQACYIAQQRRLAHALRGGWGEERGKERGVMGLKTQAARRGEGVKRRVE